MIIPRKKNKKAAQAKRKTPVSKSGYAVAKANARAMYSAIVAVTNAERMPGSPVAEVSAKNADRAAEAVVGPGAERTAYAVPTPTTSTRRRKSTRRPRPAAVAAAEAIAEQSSRSTVKELFVEAASAAEETATKMSAKKPHNSGVLAADNDFASTNKDVQQLFDPSTTDEEFDTLGGSHTTKSVRKNERK